MTPRLIIRPPVVVDMEQIADYLAERSINAADRFLDACHAEFDRLAAMPLMGGLRGFADPWLAGLRSWTISGFPNHLIFYRPIEDGVEILHVLHGARNLGSIFGDEESE